MFLLCETRGGTQAFSEIDTHLMAFREGIDLIHSPLLFFYTQKNELKFLAMLFLSSSPHCILFLP